MYADNQFLNAMTNKLMEVADNCIDEDTKEELYNLINSMVEQMEIQSNIFVDKE